MEEIQDLLGNRVAPTKDLKMWAKPSEFDQAKVITVVNFQSLLATETLPGREWTLPDKTKTFYKPFDGRVRRLTFNEDAFIGNRKLDVGWPSFEKDLMGVRPNDRISLQRTKVENKYKWVWKKL
jgi:hypothetical protein